jgi:2-methylisocitrate lyase-like PEP mutase family enzyme
MPRKVLQCGGCFNAGSAPRIADLERLGFSIAIFPGGTARAAAFAFAEYFASRKAHGTTASHRGRMIDFDELQRLLGTADMLALGKRYDDPGA